MHAVVVGFEGRWVVTRAREGAMVDAGTVPEERCACGEPLHYKRPEVREAVEMLIAARGLDVIRVVTPEGVWWVPMHYIALHGLAMAELPALARLYHFRRDV